MRIVFYLSMIWEASLYWLTSKAIHVVYLVWLSRLYKLANYDFWLMYDIQTTMACSMNYV